MADSDSHTRSDLSPFKRVNAWIFDLDNTLYPRHVDLFKQVDQRISEYVSKLLDIAHDDARKVQKDYYQRYGTTLRGLMLEHDIEPDAFLEYVHDIDHSWVEPDEHLGAAIENLPGRKFIFTNGSHSHAVKVAERLGITRHFDDIFDIVAADLMPKPNRESYDRFIARTGIDPLRAAMFEDLHRNLTVPHAIGMVTTLVVPAGTREVFHEDWELEGREAPHVGFVTDHLGDFLHKVLETTEEAAT